MYQDQSVMTRSAESVLATNKVLRNTYALLSMTLIFSGLMAFAGIAMQVAHGAALIANIVAIVMLWFVLPRTAIQRQVSRLFLPLPVFSVLAWVLFLVITCRLTPVS